MIDQKNYSLLRHNTFGIDAKCKRFIEYSSVEEAQQVARMITGADRPLLILGGGSNLLLTGDYNGTVLHSGIRFLEQTDECHVRCGSGFIWDDVVDYCVANNLYGAENLSIIPGEVGASAVQNIGAYGAEAKDLIECVEAVEIETGQICRFTNTECAYSYRQSKFKHAWKNRFLITAVTYKLSKTYNPKLDYGNIRVALAAKGIDNPTAMQLRETIIDIRNAKLPDPKVLGNAGSFFMNPVVSTHKYNQLAQQYVGMPHYTIDSEYEKIPAGWLIEQCGWKGKALGKAAVHNKQALVLVNCGGATGSEVVQLYKTIQHDVKQKFDIEIKPEVNIC
ncbi:MAG: UDP-N-acetylmuramate dehydrogenase [Prevotella pallens]|jgi:UDP-N-acetylmuramate dehydrogenase|uniref:UDP-N-acetylmuramate dehydrogenase n=1 Tax=Prevotella pallens TaxID=60133 RepID=UPI001CB0F963|nr:UDP-N-acetylmuramate dehydrogenase [Prevotella pallens]MBF1486451.1 UDP-N-acetylmuramate dehydrogenase [Prevotella pallens]MBF1488948.1 UDP-N-acetylmuramate dehydrogenase [Prevotella pallens]MBF1491180.1 UDP-N-acetylmuramate dehydrogenase [Prevotella pallens]MBF1493280.1 UDP-N-acetylmuramate dehydrogenase [Prevotella pallens]MBF1506722.1 UDP-N-acetylmuramate dehydrogenase [Prevotella pallens]